LAVQRTNQNFSATSGSTFQVVMLKKDFIGD
jgi:hypothetical protein